MNFRHDNWDKLIKFTISNNFNNYEIVKIQNIQTDTFINKYNRTNSLI